MAQPTTLLGLCCKEALKKLFQVHQEITDSYWSWEGWSLEMLSDSNAAEALHLLLNLAQMKGLNIPFVGFVQFIVRNCKIIV